MVFHHAYKSQYFLNITKFQKNRLQVVIAIITISSSVRRYTVSEVNEEKDVNKIQSLLMGFSVIDIVLKHGVPIKFNEIHHKSNFTKSNLSKYLSTLLSLEILYRDSESGLFSPGSKILEYGMIALNQEDVISKTTPILEEINLESSETTLLAVWTPSGPMIAKMINSLSGLNLGGQVGSILPIHSAVAKVFCAFKSGPILDKWIEDQLINHGNLKKEDLISEIQKIRELKFSSAEDSLRKNINSMAVPILNFNNEIIGVIAIVGFKEDLPIEEGGRQAEFLTTKSKEISKIFGYKGS